MRPGQLLGHINDDDDDDDDDDDVDAVSYQLSAERPWPLAQRATALPVPQRREPTHSTPRLLAGFLVR